MTSLYLLTQDTREVAINNLYMDNQTPEDGAMGQRIIGYRANTITVSSTLLFILHIQVTVLLPGMFWSSCEAVKCLSTAHFCCYGATSWSQWTNEVGVDKFHEVAT